MSAPHLIVQVCFGPARGVKRAIAVGASLTVGSDPSAGLALADDTSLAPVHLELRWDGVRASVHHRGGAATFTCLAGQVVQEATLTHGAWLRAGGTDLMVHIEARTPAAIREPTEAARSEQALAALREAPGPWFAILDLARDDRIQVLLRESVDACAPLFDGVEGDRLADVGPQLVALVHGSRLTDDLVREGHGQRWGVFLSSRLVLGELRRHLRRFLLARMVGVEGRLFFRYYDPGVLQVYLASCNADERAAWFGGAIERVMGEDDAPGDGWWRAAADGSQ